MIPQCRNAHTQIEELMGSLNSALWVSAENIDWREMRELFNKVRQEAERVVDDLDRNMNGLEAQG